MAPSNHDDQEPAIDTGNFPSKDWLWDRALDLDGKINVWADSVACYKFNSSRRRATSERMARVVERTVRVSALVREIEQNIDAAFEDLPRGWRPEREKIRAEFKAARWTAIRALKLAIHVQTHGIDGWLDFFAHTEKGRNLGNGRSRQQETGRPALPHDWVVDELIDEIRRERQCSRRRAAEYLAQGVATVWNMYSHDLTPTEFDDLWGGFVTSGTSEAERTASLAERFRTHGYSRRVVGKSKSG
jgi:hypothetical protein